MSCCGRNRQQAMVPRPVGSTKPVPGRTQRPVEIRHTSAVFEYVGQTRLVVIGPVSGRRYEFDQPGRRLAVDPVDKPGVNGVPSLRLIVHA